MRRVLTLILDISCCEGPVGLGGGGLWAGAAGGTNLEGRVAGMRAAGKQATEHARLGLLALGAILRLLSSKQFLRFLALLQHKLYSRLHVYSCEHTG